MHVCKQKYFTKFIYVCLGSKIPWTRMYIEKCLTKIYICLGSKYLMENKQEKEINKKRGYK